MIRVILALTTAAALILGVAPTAAVAATKPSADTVRQYILTKTNEARAKSGLKALTLNSSITKISQACSEKQAKNKKMAHCDGYYKQYPAGWKSAAENVAFGYDYTKVVNAWMNSAGHKKNILSSSTDIGIGVAYDSKGAPYFTQNFAQYSVFKGTIAISGTAKVGSVLKAKTANFPTGTSFSYAWIADGKVVANQNHSSFTLTKAVAGKTVKVKVTAKKSGYSTVTKTSAGTSKIKS